MASERYGASHQDAAVERRRLGYLAETRDPRTFGLLAELGIVAGCHAWELGAGAGTVAAWMAERVGERGSVWSTDIDLQFHQRPPPNVVVQQHDVVHDPVPRERFDVVHARAVLQHIPERDEVLPKLVAALKPGGSILIEEGDFQAFATQKLPEPLATVHAIINAVQPSWREANYGNRVAFELRALGCIDVDVVGNSWSMHAHEASGEWWYLAVERLGPRLIEGRAVTPEQFSVAMEQMRAPDFAMIGPLSLAISAKTPTRASQ